MVKAAIRADVLKKAVSFVVNGLQPSKTDLESQLVLLRLHRQSLVLFTSNKDSLNRADVGVEASDAVEPVYFSLVGERLSKLVSVSDSDVFVLEIGQEDVKVTAGKLEVSLTSFNSPINRGTLDSLSNSDSHSNSNSANISSSVLEDVLSVAKSCGGKDSLRPETDQLELRKGRFITSDGNKIILYAPKDSPNFNLQVPKNVISSLLGAVKAIGAETLAVSSGSGSYYFIRSGCYMIGLRKLEKSFPDMEGKIDSWRQGEVTTGVRVDRGAFKVQVDGVSIGIESDEVKIDLEVSGDGNDATIMAVAESRLGFKSRKPVGCVRYGTDSGTSTASVSYKHILDTLEALNGDKTVVVNFLGSIGLCLVIDKTDAREILFLIPYRTPKQYQKEREQQEADVKSKRAAKKEKVADAPAAPDSRPTPVAELD